MRHFLIVSSSILLTTITSGAFAADAVAIQDPIPVYVAPAFSWSGAYIGGQVDYSMSKGKYSFANSPEAKDTGKGTSKGFVGGIYAGYNFNVGNNVIFGTELDVTSNFGKGKAKDMSRYSTYATTDTRWSGAARARVGYAMDRFLPYVAGGVAFGGIKDTLKSNGSSFTSDKTRAGWTVGGGVDYAATDNVVLRLEYRYTDFGKQNYNLNNSANFSRKLSTNDVRIGVAYKF